MTRIQTTLHPPKPERRIVMAIFREDPKCIFCNKVIGKVKYKDQSDIPLMLQTIGDTFEGYEYEDHECEEMKKFKKNIKQTNNK